MKGSVFRELVQLGGQFSGVSPSRYHLACITIGNPIFMRITSHKQGACKRTICLFVNGPTSAQRVPIGRLCSPVFVLTTIHKTGQSTSCPMSCPHRMWTVCVPGVCSLCGYV